MNATPPEPPQTSGPDGRESARAFLKARADWLKVEAVDRGNGGFDIALIIDGTYYPPQSREELVGYFARWLDDVLRHEGI